MKKQMKAVLMAATLAVISGAPAMAEDLGHGLEGSMNVALTTDYVWRGISQSGNHGAIQGGADISHSSGVYAGMWGSSVDFDTDTSTEFDYYAGYSVDVTEDFNVDVGYIAYTYTDEQDLNFEELYANLSYMGVKLGVASSGSLVGEDSTTYISLGYETEIEGYGLAVGYGTYDFKDDVFGTDDTYDNYSLSVSKSALGADWALTWTDTNIDSADCEAVIGDSDRCDSIVALSVSKSL